VETALAMDRLHFVFTATFHYLFPQLTMGLALLIVGCALGDVGHGVPLKASGDFFFSIGPQFWSAFWLWRRWWFTARCG
jgi:hypothetical protein